MGFFGILIIIVIIGIIFSAFGGDSGYRRGPAHFRPFFGHRPPPPPREHGPRGFGRGPGSIRGPRGDFGRGSGGPGGHAGIGREPGRHGGAGHFGGKPGGPRGPR